MRGCIFTSSAKLVRSANKHDVSICLKELNWFKQQTKQIHILIKKCNSIRSFNCSHCFFFLHPSSQGCLITAWINEAAQRVHSVTLLCCMCGVDAKAPVTAAPDGLKKKHHTRRIDVKTLRRFQLLYKCNNRQVAEAMFSVCVSLSHTHAHHFP